MPRYKQVDSLESLMADIIQPWLLKCATKHLGPKKRRLQKNYINQFLNMNIRQKILNRVSSTHKYSMDINAKCTLMELLCDLTTNTLDFTAGGTLYVEELFALYRAFFSCSPKNIVKLGILCQIKGLSDRAYIKDVNSFFYRQISEMEHLRWVSLPGCGESEIMRQLALYCFNLEYLNLESSQLVDDDALFGFLLCNPEEVEDMSDEDLLKNYVVTNPCTDTIKFLGLNGTEISTRSIVLIFAVCGCVASLGGYINLGSMLTAFNMIQTISKGVTFPIIHLWEYRITSSQAIHLKSMCPHLCGLSTSGKSMEFLIELDCDLKSLTIECDYQCWSEDIYDYLEIKGDVLTKLILIDGIHCKLDITNLCYLTPHLYQLEARITVSDTCRCIPLENLNIGNVIIDSSVCLSKFIDMIPEIRDLSVDFDAIPYYETCSCINDEFIMNIFNNNNSGLLFKLRNITFTQCNLGILAAEGFLQHCVGLQSMSKLSLWKGLSEMDFNNLRNKCSQLNWDVHLIYSNSVH